MAISQAAIADPCLDKLVVNAGFRARTKKSGGGDADDYRTPQGRQELTGCKDGKKLTCDLYKQLFDCKTGILRNVEDRSGKLSILVDANGGRMRLDYFKKYDNLIGYLLAARSGNMAQQLSAQLLLAELNLAAGRIRGSMVVLTSAVTDPATGAPIPATVLHALTVPPIGANPWRRVTPADGGVALVQTVVDSSIQQLLRHNNTTAASGNRIYQRGLMLVLAGVNAGEIIVV
jgi:hypothetical protein